MGVLLGKGEGHVGLLTGVMGWSLGGGAPVRGAWASLGVCPAYNVRMGLVAGSVKRAC